MKPTALIAASGARTRRMIARAIGRYPRESAENAEEVLRRVAEDPRPLLLIWALEPGGEFDLGPLEAVRAMRPLLPVLVLDPTPPPAGVPVLRLGGLTFVFKPFRARLLRREAALLAPAARREAPRSSSEVLAYAARRLASARCVFEHLPVAATLTDARGRVLDVNREAERLAGGRPDWGAAQSCRDYWGCRASRKNCPLRRALATGRPVYHARVPADGPDGERTLVERVSVFSEPGGARRAVIVTGPATAFFRRLKLLRRDASLDLLTSVLNRGRFDALTERALRDERRGGHRGPYSFIMLDIDDFKIINDLNGHAAGDRVLRRLGRVLTDTTRHGDLVGRVGGDEFAIFCPDTNLARAKGLVRRLRRAIAADNALHPDAPQFSVQFGVASAGAKRASGLRELADAQLYRRKRVLAAARRGK